MARRRDAAVCNFEFEIRVQFIYFNYSLVTDSIFLPKDENRIKTSVASALAASLILSPSLFSSFFSSCFPLRHAQLGATRNCAFPLGNSLDL